ncbi:MAG TPA: serine hydrolase domain-containing protein [Rhizomicrobium sp.]|jgi:CubicO group peptidase (beta-lactamase class C family)|nr:serine hydrolase domain-containing protein [Rhizomicrobium sp.]
MPTPAERLATNVLPIVRIKGENLRYTMDERRAHYACPAVGVAVIDGGELAWAAGYGDYEENGDRKIDENTMFSGASISKTYTAMLALQLVERGVWNLDANVNRYLKSWQVPENEFTKQEPVTLRWLLSHKAGTTIHGFGRYPHDKPMPTALDILKGPVQFMNGTTKGVFVDKVPGGTTRYSGGGTTIVEQMLEDATGKRFHQLASENIFEPLGMKHSTFEVPLPQRFHNTTATGHEGGAKLPEKFCSVPAVAAGAIFCTPADHARFMVACRDAYFGKKGAILNQQLAQQMMTIQGEHGEFGLGWEIMGTGPNRRFGHGGSNDGYQCESTCYLEDGKGAVVMTSADSGIIFYWEVFNAVADMYGWRDFMLEEKVVQKIPEEQFARWAGDYDLISGVDAPGMKIWGENGKLMSQIIGMRGGAREIMMDQNGRFFNRNGPYETAVVYDDNNIARELVVLRDGKTEVIRARRKV